MAKDFGAVIAAVETMPRDLRIGMFAAGVGFGIVTPDLLKTASVPGLASDIVISTSWIGAASSGR